MAIFYAWHKTNLWCPSGCGRSVYKYDWYDKKNKVYRYVCRRCNKSYLRNHKTLTLIK